ncbi:hypothetical protein [Streptomyces sp. NPDC047981]|uniref:hypothetical protein n=1 Tax=Streptomyces sp. NPDC047981 TaxID=3154610 RepID=UPI00343AF8D1
MDRRRADLVRHAPRQDRARLLPACGTHIAARDYGEDKTIIGILATALDGYDADPALAPTNLNRLAEAAPWLAEAS